MALIIILSGVSFLPLPQSNLSSETIQEAGVCFTQAENLYKNKQYSESIALFEKCLKIMEPQPDKPEIVIAILGRIASSYSNLGDKEKSLKYYKRSLDLAISHGLYDKINSSLLFTMSIYKDLGRNTEGEKFCDDILQKIDKSKLIPDIGIYYDLWALAYSEKKLYSEALACNKKALDIYTAINDKSDMAEALAAIGNNYFSMMNFNDAVEYYLKALELAESLKKDDLTSSLLGYTASAYSENRNFNKAIEFYTRAFAVEEKKGNLKNMAGFLDDIAWQYRELNNYNRAAEYYLKALKITEKTDDTAKTASLLNKTGSMYSAMENYNSALEYFNKASEIYLNIRDQSGYAGTLMNISSAQLELSDYDRALENIQKAYGIYQNEKLNEKLFGTMLALGEVYYRQGMFRNTLNSFKKAGDYAEGAVDKAVLALDTGNLYYSWGNYDSATESYRDALKNADSFEEKYFINIFKAKCKGNMALVKSAQMKYDDAISLYREAISICEKNNLQSDMADFYNGTGTAYLALEKFNDALNYFSKAGLIYKQLNLESKTSVTIHNTGWVYFTQGKYDDALTNFKTALSIAERLGEKTNIAAYLDSIGIACWHLKDYKNSETSLKKAISIKEKLRLEVDTGNRRDYLASQIKSYRLLASGYVRNGQYENAFDAIELSSAKYMVDLLKSKQKKDDFAFDGIKKYSKQLPESSAIVRFTGINVLTGMTVFIVEKGGVHAYEISADEFISSVRGSLKITNDGLPRKSRGITVMPSADFKDTKKDDDQLSFNMEMKSELMLKNEILEQIIFQYRKLLTKSKLSVSEKENLKLLGSKLYALLFSAIEDKIKGKKQLIIIPDGVLGTLPFETLIMPDGRYMIEQYEMKYTQSLTVSELIARRKYSGSRKPLIGFGGAVYEQISYNSEAIESDEQLSNFKKYVQKRIEKNEKLGDAYYSLGIAGWKELSGTEEEVDGIKEIVRGSEIKKGRDVDEGYLKKLSGDGSLKKFKVLHFACHGIAIPEIPSLSALVLSQFDKSSSRDDGYLTLDEISQLEINADFVNLSACETGLGKIYSGEGIVGLSQSFLIAGANGMSVSLWQVSDESTRDFMLGVYRLTNSSKPVDYAEAMAIMKRKFIIERKLDPYHWAPFVYYGK